MADTKLFLVLVAGLVLSTLVVGLMLLSYNAWMEDVNDDGVPDGTDFYEAACPPGSYYCKGIATKNVTTSMNFTTACTANASFMLQEEIYSTSFLTKAPIWRCHDGVGWISEEGSGIVPAYRYLLFTDVQPDNGRYNNTYIVNNTVDKPFSIIIDYTNALNERTRLDISKDRVEYYGEEENIPDQTWGSYDLFQHNILTITTSYNPIDHTLEWSINEGSIGASITMTPDEPLIPNVWDTHIYAGIATKDVGVNLRGMRTLIIEDPFSKDPGLIETMTNFFGVIWGMVTFDTDTLCTSTGGETDCIPWFIIVLFIYVPAIVLVAWVVQVIRGA